MSPTRKGGDQASGLGAPQESFEVQLSDGDEQQVVEKAKSKAVRDIDEDSDDDAEEELTWRSDPKLSLSDWTIEIVITGTTKSHLYYVHKSVLAVGPKRSNYFATVFLNAELKKPKEQELADDDDIGGIEPCDFFQESMRAPKKLISYVDHKSNHSKIELDKRAADAFPALLDFLYSSANKLNIMTANATALHHLSARFEIKALRRRVKEFWHKDLNMNNLVTYYAHARFYDDQKITDHAEAFCAQNIFEIEEDDVVNILSAVDPNFFLAVVMKVGEINSAKAKAGDRMEFEDGSKRLSLLIAVYLNLHRAEVNPQMFQKLTAASHLPVIEFKAAKVLLGLENDICNTAGTVTPLKTRVFSVLVANWEESCFDVEDGNVQVSLPPLKGQALFHFSGAVLKQAYHATRSLKTDIIKIKKQQKDFDSLARFHQEALKINGEATETLLEKDETIAALKEQMLTQEQAFEEIKLSMKADHEKEIRKLQEGHQIELQKVRDQNDVNELRNQAKSFKVSAFKLSHELTETKRQLANVKDKLKLQRVADEGAGRVLKKTISMDASPDPIIDPSPVPISPVSPSASEDEKKTGDV